MKYENLNTHTTLLLPQSVRTGVFLIIITECSGLLLKKSAASVQNKTDMLEVEPFVLMKLIDQENSTGL
jgi:hypothetical protein